MKTISTSFLVLSLFIMSPIARAADLDRDTLPDDWELANGRDPNKPDYAIAAGKNHQCVIDEEGVKCWGDNANGQTDVPAGLIRPYALSAGDTWSCVCDDNGSTCWGINPPATPSCDVSIAGASVYEWSSGSCTCNAFGLDCKGTGYEIEALISGSINQGQNIFLNLEGDIQEIAPFHSDHFCGPGGTYQADDNDLVVQSNSVVQLDANEGLFCFLDNYGVTCLDAQYEGFDSDYYYSVVYWSVNEVEVPGSIVFDSDGDGVQNKDDTCRLALATDDNDSDGICDADDIDDDNDGLSDLIDPEPLVPLNLNLDSEFKGIKVNK